MSESVNVGDSLGYGNPTSPTQLDSSKMPSGTTGVFYFRQGGFPPDCPELPCDGRVVSGGTWRYTPFPQPPFDREFWPPIAQEASRSERTGTKPGGTGVTSKRFEGGHLRNIGRVPAPCYPPAQKLISAMEQALVLQVRTNLLS